MDSSQLSNANATRAALEGCIEVINSYKEVKSSGDSLISTLKAKNGSLQNQNTLFQEQNVVNQEIITDQADKIKKAEKKAKFKKIANSTLFATFALISAALTVLYITK